MGNIASIPLFSPVISGAGGVQIEPTKPQVDFGRRIVKIHFFKPFLVCGGHRKPCGSRNVDFQYLY